LVFTTERFVVRALTPGDAEDFFAIFGDPQVMRFLGSGDLPAYPDVAHARTVLERMAARPAESLGMWACEERATGRVPATVGLTKTPHDDEIEVFYQVARADWGRGIATECARAAIDYGFDRAGLQRIVAYAFAQNPASLRVLEKIGMHHAGARPYEGNDLEYFWIER
jgi:ribosomal-protein-alanine N-acetyltransferase